MVAGDGVGHLQPLAWVSPDFSENLRSNVAKIIHFGHEILAESPMKRFCVAAFRHAAATP
jgi:hypothetical protein